MSARILVGGIGGVVGYGALRALRAHDPSLVVIGCDIHEHAVGRAWADEFLRAPRAASGDWPDWLAGALESVDLFIPTLDPELDRFAADPGLAASLPATVALPGNATLAAAQDKWLLDQALGDDPMRIRSSVSTDFATLSAELGAPFLVKPRSGYGSRGIRTIATAAEFEQVREGLGSALLAQQLVGDDEHEYTVGVFGDGEGGVAASITLHRRLAPEGMTVRARCVAPVPSIEQATQRVARLLRPAGAVNLQFRLHEGQAKLLEINARLSSTTSMRTAFGYNEAGMLADFHLRGIVPAQPVLRRGEAIRYLEDLVTLE